MYLNVNVQFLRYEHRVRLNKRRISLMKSKILFFLISIMAGSCLLSFKKKNVVLTLNVVYSNISNKRSVEFYLICTKDLPGAVGKIHHLYI